MGLSVNEEGPLLLKNIASVWHIQRPTQQFHSLGEIGIFSSSKVGFLNLCTIDIWDWIIICCGGLSHPVNWRMFHICGLDPQCASSTATLIMTTQNVFRHF